MDATLGHQVLYDFLWLGDPTAWAGLLTLTLIQIVLGIDNLIFIAVLSARLPPEQRRRATYLGIGGALLIRLGLLTAASYLAAMVQPWVVLWGHAVSPRDLILMIGGIFLLYKSSAELHGKLEGADGSVTVTRAGGSSLGMVAVQIMVLDALFSVDAIVTAVGMTPHVFIMMAAVTAAMAVMTLASGVVTDFVTRHPTVVILCLGFLLLIGFSLMLEAVHIEVPKGYLYAAIGFAVLIEGLNQIARKNTLRLGKVPSMQSRETAAKLVLRLLGASDSEVPTLRDALAVPAVGMFDKQEKEMVSRVLQLSSLPVKAVMTARPDVDWLRLDAPPDELRQAVAASPHSRLVAYAGTLRDQPLGYVHRADVLTALLRGRCDRASLEAAVRQPLQLPETVSILKALDEFRHEKRYQAFIWDEFGNFEGMVTLHDIMEEVAGELPDQSELPEVIRVGAGVWQVGGEVVLTDLERITGFKVPRSPHYQTLAGFVLDYLQRLPAVGEVLALGGWQAEITAVADNSIETVRLRAPARRRARVTGRP